jgi:hypothetical protein
LLTTSDPVVDELEVVAEGFENSKRKTVVLKTLPAYGIYSELITYYGMSELLDYIVKHKIKTFEDLKTELPFRAKRTDWENVGGQLLPQASVDTLIKQVNNGKMKSWDDVHSFYAKNSAIYEEQKFQHAFASLMEWNGLNAAKFDRKKFRALLEKSLVTREWITKAIYDSREKDHHNDFRKMVYENQEQMDRVVGKLDENVFIQQQVAALKTYKSAVGRIIKKFGL